MMNDTDNTHMTDNTDPQLINTSSQLTDSQLADAPLVIGIVAGEISGDSLGADFMRQMNAITTNIRWVGVGGAQMQAEGLEPIFDMSRLSVMGLVEVIKHLPDLFKARKELLSAFADAQIDCFIGIDAPDFNLRIAKPLKQQGIFTVQYVSPSIWAWRENRIHNIKEATNLVLCLFPFELAVYKKHAHPAVCVGHPLLHSIDKKLLNITTPEFRRDLVWQTQMMLDYFANRSQDISHIICVMPGSRRSEVKLLLPLMLRAIEYLLDIDENLCFIIPTVNQTLQKQIQAQLDKSVSRVRKAVGVIYEPTDNNISQQIMAMSDLVLLASGTATLEAMLLNRPMVVIYKLNALTYQIAKRMVHIPYVALPNILAKQEIVSELIQQSATAENISREVWQTLSTDNYQQQVKQLQQQSKLLYEQSKQTPANAFVEHLVHAYQSS